MIELKIGVVGIFGKWLIEVFVDVFEVCIGFCFVVDMVDVFFDLSDRLLIVDEYDLCKLDGLVIKKIS